MKDQCYQFIKNQIGKTNIVGFGSYGQVKIARNTQNSQVVAIKLIHGKNAKQEIDVHHKLNHPNIIKLLNYYYQKQKNITYMVLQYAENGSLNQKIKFGLGQLSKQLIRKYFKNICQAIKYLHKHNYMHRDIKPQNILITKDNVAKLCDFGFVAIFQARTTMCGTFEYMAPEMIKKKHYTYKIDIWALGILLFQMIQGIAPFRGQTGEQVISQMKKPIKFSARFDSLQIDLIKKILRVNSENRPTVQQILDHPYFKSIKQDQKINLIRNTVQIQSKSPKMQQTHFIKDKMNSSKQQLTRFLKNSNQKIPNQNQNNFYQPKKRSPFGYTYIKTQPTSNDSFINNNLSQSFKTKNSVIQQSELKKGPQFRKYSNNGFGAQSPQADKKTKSPVNSRTEIKIENNIDTSLRSQKKVGVAVNLFSNNFNSNTKITNLNKSRNQESDIGKKTSITGKLDFQKNISQSTTGSFQFLNKSFKTLKTNNEINESNLKPNINLQPQSKPNQMIYNPNNVNKQVSPSGTGVNTSFKYPKSGSPQFQNSNMSMNSYQHNYEARKHGGSQQTGFSYNQIYNLQKSANISSPQKLNNLTRLKQTYK